MRIFKLQELLLLLFFCGAILIISCKGGSDTPPPNNPCAGITVAVTGTTTDPTTANNGSIAASATGGNGFTYSLNGGSFQSSGTFSNLAAGSYSITAKNSNGCTGTGNFTLNSNACSGVAITLSFNNTSAVPCQTNNGSITATASGGAGPYQYSLNNGTFQSSNVFTSLAAATYTISVKDANNCLASSATTVNAAAAGPLFTQVKTMMQSNCAISGCHAGTQSPDFRVDCNIVSNAALIQQRAVLGNPSVMPPTGSLSAADKQKITDWVNAGGKFDN